MHSKVLLSGVLAALAGTSIALPISADVAETATNALDGTTSGNVVAVIAVNLSTDDVKDLDVTPPVTLDSAETETVSTLHDSTFGSLVAVILVHGN